MTRQPPSKLVTTTKLLEELPPTSVDGFCPTYMLWLGLHWMHGPQMPT